MATRPSENGSVISDYRYKETYSEETPGNIKILYFEGCPSYGPAVALVRQVVATLGVAAEIEEIDIKSQEQAAAQRFLGSPVSGDLKLLFGGRAQNVSEPLSVFFLKI